MKIYYLPIILLLLANLSIAQSYSNEETALDSLISGFEEQIMDNFDTIELREIRRAIWVALEKTKHINAPKLTAKAHDMLSFWYLYNVHEENRDSVLHHNEQYLFYANQSQDVATIATAHEELGYSLTEIGQYEKAESHLFQAAELYEQQDAFLDLGYVYISLAGLYRETGDEQALAYAEKAMTLIAEHKENELDILDPLRMLVLLYEPEQALEKAQEVIDLIYAAPADRSNLTLEKAHAIRSRAVHLQALERYDEALQDYQTALGLVRELTSDEKHTNGWKGGIADVLYLQKKYAQAIPYFKDYIAHVEALNMDVHS